MVFENFKVVWNVTAGERSDEPTKTVGMQEETIPPWKMILDIRWDRIWMLRPEVFNIETYTVIVYALNIVYVYA